VCYKRWPFCAMLAIQSCLSAGAQTWDSPSVPTAMGQLRFVPHIARLPSVTSQDDLATPAADAAENNRDLATGTSESAAGLALPSTPSCSATPADPRFTSTDLKTELPGDGCAASDPGCFPFFRQEPPPGGAGALPAGANNPYASAETRYFAPYASGPATGAAANGSLDGPFSFNAAADASAQPSPSAQGSTAGGKQPLGEAPENVADLFLSQATVLLKPGEVEVDVGVQYSFQDTKNVVLVENSSGQQVPAIERMRDRIASTPVAVRYGLTDKIELFASLPLGVAWGEDSNVSEVMTDTHDGFGDAKFGVLFTLVSKKDRSYPDITGSLSVIAPTGCFDYSGNDASLGQGYWSVSASLNLIKSYDPFVYFGSFGYRYDFASEHENLWIQPGGAVTYSLGVAFSITDDTAVSAELDGLFQNYTVANGQPVPNSFSEPVSLQLSLTRRNSSTFRWEPFVSIGLTNDAPNFVFGVILTRDYEQPAATPQTSPATPATPASPKPTPIPSQNKQANMMFFPDGGS